ncbi:MAG: cytochrome c family protein [Rhodospirillales bacterium]|nr:cytochrome c family protein [Rhodospirillales bacterium]
MMSFLEKAGAGLLIAAWLIWGGHMLADVLVAPRTAGSEKLPFAETKTAAAPAATAAAAAPPQDFKTLLAAATPDNGAKVFRKCVACHAAEKGAKHKVGPALWDVVGRSAAKADGFNYSPALGKVGKEWTYENLDTFLKSPKDYAPGNKMTFAGLPDAAERAAVIAFLRSLSDSPKPLP